MRGKMVDGLVVLDPNGKPVVETEEPSAPLGYVKGYGWEETSESITQVWWVKPVQGTAEESTVALARILALSLDDAQALMVPALYDEWAVGVEYSKGDRRVYQGTLYKYISEEPSTSTQEWNPKDAHSLWVEVSVPTDEPQPWEQRIPGVKEGYRDGEKVTHNGQVRESTKPDNYDQPGYPGTAWVVVG